jgi:anthranilate phosphoribosyltransferase
VPAATAADLTGGDRKQNRELAIRILHAERGARRDIVLVNAAAAILSTNIAQDLDAAMKLATESIDSGAAWAKVKQLAEFSRSVS